MLPLHENFRGGRENLGVNVSQLLHTIKFICLHLLATACIVLWGICSLFCCFRFAIVLVFIVANLNKRYVKYYFYFTLNGFSKLSSALGQKEENLLGKSLNIPDIMSLFYIILLIFFSLNYFHLGSFHIPVNKGIDQN